jgi:hypothetical protein
MFDNVPAPSMHAWTVHELLPPVDETFLRDLLSSAMTSTAGTEI